MVPNEAIAYGYQDEDRHMAESFLRGEMPTEDWRDGLLVSQIMMAAYMSAEKGRRMKFDPGTLRGYKPKVMSGEWDPRSTLTA